MLAAGSSTVLVFMKARNQSAFLPFLWFLYSYMSWTVTAFLDVWSAWCERARSEPQCLLFPDHLTFAWSLCPTVRRALGVFSPWLCALCTVKGDRRASRPVASEQETPQNDATDIKYSTTSSVFVCQKTLKETTRAFFRRWPGLHPCLRTADPRLTSQVNIILLCMASPAYERVGMPRSGDSGQPMND